MRMKLLLVLCLLTLVFTGCSKEMGQAEEAVVADPMEMREIAWDSLMEEEKSTVIGDWKRAEVTPSKWESIPWKKQKQEAASEHIVRVVFKTDKDPFLGPIGIYINVETGTIAGYNIRH